MPLSALIQSGGTFTPDLRFGGANVGMTYTTVVGTYTRVGDRIFYSVQLILSAKGSSVGAASIINLPVAAATTPANTTYPAIAMTQNMAAGITAFPAASVNAAQNTLFLYKEAAGVQTALADTDFTATTQIAISGSYAV